MKKHNATKRVSARRAVKASIFDNAMLNVESLDRDMQSFIGKDAKRAKQFLKDLGFECTLVAGPSKNNDSYWEEYTTNGDEPGSIMVKLYFPLMKSGNRWIDGELEDYYVDSYTDVYTSTRTRNRRITAAVDGGWEVPDWRANEAYDLALENGWTEEDLNSEIVQTLSSEELASTLAFIFRMNDFQEWNDYLDENPD